MSLIRLIILPESPDQETTYRVVDDKGVLERGAVALASPPHPDLRTVLVVPGVDVLCRWLTLPRGPDHQVAVAASLMLEDELAGGREGLHVALGRAEPDGTRLVAVVDRVRMKAWLAAAEALGVRPHAVCPGQLLLPEPEGDEAVTVIQQHTALVRGRGLALACDVDLLPTVMQGRPYRLVESGADAERLAVVAAAHTPIDLQQGVFSSRASSRSRTRLTAVRLPILAGLVLVSLIALPVVRGVRAEMAIHTAALRIESLAGSPRPTSASEAMTRLRTQAAAARAAEAFPARASALFAAVQGIEGMELQSLIYDPDGALRATLGHVNYSDVELLCRSLERSGLAVDEKSAVAEGGRVTSDVVVRGRP